MAHARALFVLALWLLCAGAVSARGPLWRPCSLEELVATSDLVVLGRIVSIAEGEVDPQAVDTATLRIDRVLSGSWTESTLALAYPGRHRGAHGAAGEFVPDRDPSLVRFDHDQEGIFFLRRREDGTWSANHPARFKPRVFLADVEAFLAHQG